MPRGIEKPLEIDRAIPKCRFGLPAGGFEGLPELERLLDHPHTLSPSPGRRLQKDWESYLFSYLSRLLGSWPWPG